LETTEAKIHALELEGIGDGPTLVLLHGLGADCLSFASLMYRLRVHFRRIVIPDLPGHGWSDAVDGLTPAKMMSSLAEALDMVVDAPAAVVGTSLGGMCAARYAAMRPSNVGSLMLIAPGGAQLDEAALKELLTTFEIDAHRDALDFVDRCFVNLPWAARHVLAAGVKRRMSNPALRATIDRFGPEDMLRAGELASIRAPTLLVWGSEERLLPESVLEFYRENLPRGTRVERWLNFGHAGFLEQPRVMVQRIANFARDTQVGGWEPPRLRWLPAGATLYASP
ncbi:MAG: alpha/beta fold hydrolase, partial [Nannocystaceae bacterium]